MKEIQRCYATGERGHKSRKMGSLWKLEKKRK
jgi:hypothetical protein